MARVVQNIKNSIVITFSAAEKLHSHALQVYIQLRVKPEVASDDWFVQNVGTVHVSIHVSDKFLMKYEI